jgi:hypothetical protein
MHEIDRRFGSFSKQNIFVLVYWTNGPPHSCRAGYAPEDMVMCFFNFMITLLPIFMLLVSPLLLLINGSYCHYIALCLGTFCCSQYTPGSVIGEIVVCLLCAGV